jgi:hypothetical protein
MICHSSTRQFVAGHGGEPDRIGHPPVVQGPGIGRCAIDDLSQVIHQRIDGGGFVGHTRRRVHRHVETQSAAATRREVDGVEATQVGDMRCHFSDRPCEFAGARRPARAVSETSNPVNEADACRTSSAVGPGMPLHSSRRGSEN